MLEVYFKRAGRLRELRRGPLAEYMDGFAERLHRLGYSRSTARRSLRLTGRFSDFARTVGVEKAAGIDEELVARFVNEQQVSKSMMGDARRAMRHILDHLQRWRTGMFAQRGAQ